MSKRSRNQKRKRRHLRVRAKVAGTADRPRLNVFRSSREIYAQVINDDAGTTLAYASSLEGAMRAAEEQLSKTEVAGRVGKEIAKRAKEMGIQSVVFDRGGYRYHGRVKALAEAAREAGLEF